MKDFSFLMSLGCSALCREPANHRNRQRECQRVLDKLFDGQVLNEDDEHELVCLAGRDPLIVQQILAAELRLRREGNVAAANHLLMILDRVTPGEAVIREDAPRLELMDRDIREGGSVSSHSQSPSPMRHRGDRSMGTTHGRGAGLNLPGLHSSGSNIPSSASGRGTGLLVPGRQRGGPNSPASGSSQAPVTPRGVGAAQTRGSGTRLSGNQAPQQAEPRHRNPGRTGQIPESKSSNPFTHSPVRGNQRT